MLSGRRMGDAETLYSTTSRDVEVQGCLLVVWLPPLTPKDLGPSTKLAFWDGQSRSGPSLS